MKDNNVKHKSGYDNANILSKFIFWWTVPYLKKYFKRTSFIDINSCYQCPKFDQCEIIGARLSRNWEIELNKHKDGQRASLLKACWRTFGPRYLWIGILSTFIHCFVRLALPVALGLLVRYLNSWNEDIDEGKGGFQWNSHLAYVYYCAALICVLMSINVYLSHPVFFEIYRMGMQLRIANTFLIYNKALKISNAALRTTTAGQIVNLLSNDVNRFDISLVYLFYLVVGPLQMFCIIGLLWQQIGISCLAGIALMIVYIPFQGLMGHLFSKFRSKSSILTDDRLRLMSEIIPAMRVIKMYVWEKPFEALVEMARVKEISIIHKSMVLRSINLSIFFISSKLITFLCLIVFLITGGQLNPENVFVTISLVNQLRDIMTLCFPYALSLGAESLISIRRIEKFLLLENFETNQIECKERNADSTNGKLIDSKIYDQTNTGTDIEEEDKCMICVQNICADFTSSDGNVTQVLDDISFDVKPGKLTVIIGSVGSGKTAVLMAVLKELKIKSGSVIVNGKLGYASQESWIFGGTLKENILFGKIFDERKYKQVIHVAALEEDLKQLPFGDQTTVGDRGVTLSGGQRARVSLARTLYSNPDCYLLDDPLSAVDSAVAKHIFEKCIKSYLKRNCVILVTHQLQFIKAAHQIIVLKEGKMLASGSYTDLLKEGIDLIKFAGDSEFLREDEHKQVTDYGRRTSSVSELFGSRISNVSSVHSYGDETFSEIKPIDPDLKESDVKLSSTDSNNSGNTSAKVYWVYLRSGAGIIILPILVLSNIVTQVVFTGSDYWLSQWTNYHENQILHSNDGNHSLDKSWMISDEQNTNIIIYSCLVAVLFVFCIIRTVAFFTTCMRASVRLHNNLLKAVIRAPIAFFDKYPIGMILNRVSRDLGIIDDLLPPTAFDALENIMYCLAICVLCVFIDIWILVPTLAIVIFLVLIRYFALGTLRQLKKVEGMARTPIFSHLSSTLNGLTTIRSFGAQNEFLKKLEQLQDRHTNVYFLFMTCSRWLGLVLDELCLLYTVVVTIALVVNLNQQTGSSIGLTLSQAMLLCGSFQWGIRQFAEVETQMTSVERVAELNKIDRELDNDVKPPEEWPKSGQIVMRDVCLQYEGSDSPVLNNLNLTINGGETVGIVGRTGAGKSSIIATLFRMTAPTGLIEIDGVDTSAISLSTLRKHLSIIPQEPILFTETVRKNLDPFGDCSDDMIWTALEKVQLKSTIDSFPQKLDQLIFESGASFSVGQKQLICLARAVLRNNRILILDEATANVDPKTDALIQETIRNEFHDCTVLTIAHRLHTIMDYDKVLVLDSGHIAQFDSPHNLVQERDGIFAEMLESTGKSMEQHLKQIAFQSYLKKLRDFSG